MRNIFKKNLFRAFLIILITIVISIIIRYHVMGEKTLPYSLEKILIISKVSNENEDDKINIWNIKLKEVNDIYIYINKTEESDNTIKSVNLGNFKITTPPKFGNIAIYKPTGDLNSLYKLSSENYLKSNITYTGAKVDTMKKLEIRNEGGTIGFRAALNDLGTYISNNYDEEITYDGKLLSKLGTTLDEIQFSMSFDIEIKLNNNVTFIGTVNLDLPNEDILTNSNSNIEITDFSNVVFKRK